MSRQATTPVATCRLYEKNNDKEGKDGEAKAKPEVIKLGLDLHGRQVTECRQLDGSTPKPVQKWDPWKLLDQVEDGSKQGSRSTAVTKQEPVATGITGN